MERFYRSGSRAIFLLHIVLGIFYLVGWAFPSIRFMYLSLLAAWPLSWILFGYCPLTKWELTLERQYDLSVDVHEEFIQRNARKYFGLRLPSRAIYGVGLLVFCILLALSLTA